MQVTWLFPTLYNFASSFHGAFAFGLEISRFSLSKVIFKLTRDSPAETHGEVTVSLITDSGLVCKCQ